jgi:hypothetical protein
MNRILTLFIASLVLATARAQLPTSPLAPATDCQFYIWADDSFELFINGKMTWKADDYEHVVQKSIPLRPGDVVVVSVTDKQGGPGGGFAAVILRDNGVLASSKDFHYTVNPPPDFTTSPNVQNVRLPDMAPLQRSFGLGPEKQPKKAWSQKSDRKFGVVHFKYVVPK